MNNSQLAATTGFLDKIEIENETVWLGGWFLSFESEPVEKLKVYLGNVELTDFEITKNLPSPGVKKVHPNIPAAERCRFLIQLSVTSAQQEQFRDALISIIPIINNREGEPLLTAVNPSLSPLLKQQEPLETDKGESTPRVELIYVHVPKAAGTAFRKILQQIYGPQGVLTDTTNMFEDKMPPTIDRQTKVIDGHFRAGKYDKLFPNAKTITWLRQPIHRLISDYCFRQIGSLKQKEFISKERLLEFAKIPGNRNLMSYCINGKPLNYFHFIGIQEYFEEDLQDLRQLFGWQEVAAVYQNRNPYPEYNQFKKEVLADKKLIEELTALNSQDLQLYQSAWKLRDQRKKGLIVLPLTPPPKTTEETKKETRFLEETGFLETIGSIDKVVVPPLDASKGGEKSDRPLQITGWAFSPKAGLVDGFKLSIGGLKVGNLRPQIGLPSPDVKKIHPNSPSAGKARFRLQVSFSPEQIERMAGGMSGENPTVSLIPFFQGHQGKPLVKALSAEQTGHLFPPKQASLTPAIQRKTTVGYFDQAKIEKQEAIASGWVASLDAGPLTGFKVSIGGKDIEKFEASLGIASPDVAKKHPHLDNSQAARFNLRIPLAQQVEEYHDSLLVLTPVFQGGEGAVMTKVLVSASDNKSPQKLGYEIVSESGKQQVLYRGNLMAIPPKNLRIRVHGDDNLQDFLSAGLGINRDLKAAVKTIGKELKDFKNILDFGCGSGRVMMWFAADELEAVSLRGTDIDGEAVSWCKNNLPFAEFSVNKGIPPLEYDANSFDLIYLVSVFTHINEEMQWQWLQELKRIIKPEGILIISIIYTPGNPQEAAKVAAELEKNGVYFTRTHQGKDNVFPDWYQTAYISENYVRNKWANDFKIVDYIPGGIRGRQHIVVLQKLATDVAAVLKADVADGLSVEEQAPPPVAEAIATNQVPPLPPTSQGGPGGIKRSPLLEKIKAQIERSRVEIQEIKADLEGGTLPTNIKKEDPEKKTLTEKLAADVADGLSVGKQTPSHTPHTPHPLPLLGLSGVTVEKFWSLIDPVIGKQRPTTNPSISILTPTWNSSLDWFVETVLSVLQQTNPHWEWCLVDDGSKNQDIKTVLAGLAEKEPRIKVRFAESSGISGATNKALEMATGDYICCLDHDDTLTPTALEDSLDKLAEGFDVSYSDEDKIDLSGLNYIQPFLKPDWSPEYFRGVMYVGHLLCVRRELALRAGGFKSEFDGVQDYEFMLRVSELTSKIAHIPKHLYHWRQVRGSISADADAKAGIETVQQAAVNAHLQRLGLPAKGEPGLGRHRVNINPLPRTENPLISLIASSQNPDDRLLGWLNDLLSKTVYPNLEIIVVLTYEKTEQLPETINNFPIKTLRVKGKSNFARANNFATKEAVGEYLVFINPGVRSITEDWLRHLLYYGEQSDVGAVGSLLVLPDGTVEHAGIILRGSEESLESKETRFLTPQGSEESLETRFLQETGFLAPPLFPNFVMRGFKADADGYAGSLVCAREVAAISKDCLMVKKSIFEAVGGFNQHLLTGYQETDLCLKIQRENKRIIFTPRSVLLNPHSTNLQLENIDFLDKMLLLDSHGFQ